MVLGQKSKSGLVATNHWVIKRIHKWADDKIIPCAASFPFSKVLPPEEPFRKECTMGSFVLLDIPKRDQSDESDEVFLSKLWSMESTLFILHQQSAYLMKAEILRFSLIPWYGR